MADDEKRPWSFVRCHASGNTCQRDPDSRERLDGALPPCDLPDCKGAVETKMIAVGSSGPVFVRELLREDAVPTPDPDPAPPRSTGGDSTVFGLGPVAVKSLELLREDAVPTPDPDPAPPRSTGGNWP